MSPFLISIGQISVPVHNLEKATHFYQNVLGLNLVFEVPGAMSFFECGGIRLVLSVPASPEFDHPSSLIYYRVNDIDQAAKTLTSKQVEFLQDPHIVGRMGDKEVWMAFFKDPDGNVLAIMEEK
ncbi:MAG: VOC family protein [Ardenticatenaceae bacterium]|nr:VOC family protein [Ardenticatenaceae bacterium]